MAVRIVHDTLKADPRRAVILAALAKHAENYDSDCNIYSGCVCGWDNGTTDDNDGYDDHLADAVLTALTEKEA